MRAGAMLNITVAGIIAHRNAKLIPAGIINKLNIDKVRLLILEYFSVSFNILKGIVTRKINVNIMAE